MLPCAATPMESFLRQSVGVALPVRMYSIYVFFFLLFLFFVDHVCEHVMCWATPLYCELVCVQNTNPVGFHGST